jgi:hypothetical protein
LVYVRPSNEALLRARVPGAQDQGGVLPVILSCASVFLLNHSLGGRPRLSSTARMERAHSYRARSASKEDTWLLPSQCSERSFEELFREGHVLLDVRLQIAGAGLPVVFRIADPAGKTDKLF